MTIEIVDFPIENGGSFYSYVNVYQRVVPIFREPEIMKNHEKNHHVSWSRWVFFVVVKNHVESPCCMVKNPYWSFLRTPFISHSLWKMFHGWYKPISYYNYMFYLFKMLVLPKKISINTVPRSLRCRLIPPKSWRILPSSGKGTCREARSAKDSSCFASSSVSSWPREASERDAPHA